MADGGSNWWDNWLQTAKEKGSSVLEFMKKDLDEFTNTIQQETSTLMSSTAASLREKLHLEEDESTASAVKRSVTEIFGSVSGALVPTKEPNEDEAFVIKDSKPVILNRLELELLLVQRDASTYLEEPSDQEDYEAWLVTFDLESKQDELTELMATHTEVRDLYKEMVPSSVSHVVFWHRYFYHVDQILKVEEKRLAAKKQVTSSKNNLDMEFDEGEAYDNEMSGHVLTSQETDRILDDYQRECEEMEARVDKANLRTSMSAFEFSIAHEMAAADFRENPTSSPEKPSTSAPEATNNTASLNSESDVIRDTVQTENQPDEPKIAVQETETTKLEADNPIPEKPSLDSASSSSSKVSDGSTLDDEWEKDFDVGITDEDVQRILDQQESNASLNVGKQEEDWEKWQ